MPFHLFTEEAFEVYFSKLTPGGYLRFIAPNHFFDFSPLLAGYGDRHGFEFYRTTEPDKSMQHFIAQKPYSDGSLDVPLAGWVKLEYDPKGANVDG